MDLESIVCFTVMVLNQTLSAFFQPILFRIAHRQGAELPILIFYNFSAAFVVNLLMAMAFSERKIWRKLNWRDVLCASITGPLGGPVPQNIYVLSFAFASSKLASIVATLVPGVLFALNVVASKEKLSRSKECVVKVVGIVLIPIASAVLQGIMNKGSLAAELAPSPAQAPAPTSSFSTSTRTKMLQVLVGFLLSFEASTNVATWFTNYFLEAISPEFAYTFTMAALMNLFGAVVAMIYVVCRYHDKEYYNLGLNTTMGILVSFSVLLTVVATSGARWCVQIKGTCYVAAFSNLSLILDVIAAPLILNGKLEWGSVGSVVLLIIGVRSFHWGTTKDAAASTQSKDIACAHHKEEDRMDDLESGFQTVAKTEEVVSRVDDQEIVERQSEGHEGTIDTNEEFRVEDEDYCGAQGITEDVVVHHEDTIGINDELSDEDYDDKGGDQGVIKDVVDHHEAAIGINGELNDEDYDDKGGDPGKEGATDNDLCRGIVGQATDEDQGPRIDDFSDCRRGGEDVTIADHQAIAISILEGGEIEKNGVLDDQAQSIECNATYIQENVNAPS